MGKNHRHAKQLKSEKAKVKLKAKKLPKGTNVTDTSFKVKKIIIREQLKQFNDEDLLSKRKLNVKELLTRLQHHNNSTRSSAITDLKELISEHQGVILLINLSQILEGVSHLVLDRERNVRRDALKLIHMILNPISSNQISPFFDILSSYLRCAMTHINIAIQEDSLLFMDILLTCVPHLVAKNASKILPNFFNLISKLKNEMKPERTLTVNLNSKFTAVKWRTKVLSRLHDLLKAIVNYKKYNFTKTKEMIKKSTWSESEKSTDKEFNVVSYATESKFHAFDKKNFTTIPIYDSTILQTCDFSFFNKNINDQILLEDNDEETIEEFVNVIMPLLFDTWLEVGPSVKSFEENDSVLSSDAAVLLKSILEIIQLLWEMIHISEKKYLTKKYSDLFSKKHSNNFSNYFVKNFPYSQFHSLLKKNTDSSGFIINNNSNEESLLENNLMICNTFSLYNYNSLNPFQEECLIDILNYLNETLVSWKRTSNLEYLLYCVLKVILLERSKVWKNHINLIKLILNNLIGCYERKKFSDEHQINFLKLLCEVLYVTELNQHNKYQSWIASLPYILCGNNISSDIVEVLLNLCRQKNQMLMKSLMAKLPEIFDNFINKMVQTDEITEPVFIKLIHILYWLPHMPLEDLSRLKKIFKENRHNLSNNVHSHFIDMYMNKIKSVT